MKIPWPQKCHCGHTMASHDSLGCQANVIQSPHVNKAGLTEGNEIQCSCKVRNTDAA